MLVHINIPKGFMKTSNVSFGRVIALSGKESKINKINEKLAYKKQAGQLVIRDVTQHYKYAPSTGMLAKAAQRGDKVEIYITGEDVNKVGKDAEWKNIDGILSHLSSYYDAAKMSIREAVEKVIKS